MQAVYSFNAEAVGTLALTGNTVHIFDVYRKAGANWIKLQQNGQDVSIGYNQPSVAITMAGEYAVVHDNPRLACAGGATFAFTLATTNAPLPSNISLGVVAGAPDANGLPTYALAIQQQGATVGTTLQLQPIMDATGEVVAYQFAGIP